MRLGNCRGTTVTRACLPDNCDVQRRHMGRGQRVATHRADHDFHLNVEQWGQAHRTGQQPAQDHPLDLRRNKRLAGDALLAQPHEQRRHLHAQPAQELGPAQHRDVHLPQRAVAEDHLGGDRPARRREAEADAVEFLPLVAAQAVGRVGLIGDTQNEIVLPAGDPRRPEQGFDQHGVRVPRHNGIVQHQPGLFVSDVQGLRGRGSRCGGGVSHRRAWRGPG